MHTYAFDEHIQARRGKRRRALLAILLGASVATLGAGAMSLAVFTDSAAADGSWTTGQVILGVQPVAGFNVTGVMPGDTGTQDISVENSGLTDLRYAMTAGSGDALADEFNLTITAGTCASPGAVLYDGVMSGAAFGSSDQGADAGDRDVAALDSDDLCFAWELPLSTDTSFQNETATVTFTFDAEQTANN